MAPRAKDKSNYDLVDWINYVIDLALSNYSRGDNRPFVLIKLDRNQSALTRDFCDRDSVETEEQHQKVLSTARHFISTQQGRFYALAWDEYLNGEGGEMLTGIMAEVGSDAGQSALLCQTYRQSQNGGLERSDGLRFVKNLDNLWQNKEQPDGHDVADGIRANVMPSLNEFSETVLDLGIERLRNGYRLPFIFQYDDHGQFKFIRIGFGDPENDLDGVIQRVREQISKNDDLDQYGFVYYKEIEERGKRKGMVVAVCERRLGKAAKFVRRYLRDADGMITNVTETQQTATLSKLLSQ